MCIGVKGMLFKHVFNFLDGRRHVSCRHAGRPEMSDTAAVWSPAATFSAADERTLSLSHGRKTTSAPVCLDHPIRLCLH